jgi:hypothetical protein
MNFILTIGVAINPYASFPSASFGTIFAERERDEQAYIVYTYCVRTRIHISVKDNKNKSFKSYFPVGVFIGLNGETGFFYSQFYSQKQIQTNVAGVDFHRRPDCVVPLSINNLLYLDKKQPRNRARRRKSKLNRNNSSEYKQDVRISEFQLFGRPQSIIF